MPNPTRLWLDLETYSEEPITNGTHKYAESAEVMLFAWALDDAPVSVWDCTLGEWPPEALVDALDDEDVEVWAHNSHFDRTVLRHSRDDVTEAVARQTRRWRDTMVQALSHGLPGALGALCEVLQVPADQAKDKRGKQLIQLFCKPRPKTSKLRRATRETHPAEWAEFVSYAGLDIEAMRACHKRMPMWNYQGRELDLWHLDQRINDRGVAIDLALVHSAIAAVDAEQIHLAARTVTATEGQVASATQRDAMLAHILEAYGVGLPDLQMATLERRIADPDLPEPLKDLLRIRLAASTSSTSKYKALARGTSTDGRLRGTLQFNGAGRTGRWAGRLFQPQNLPRPSLPQDEIDQGVDAMLAGCADLVAPDVMALASSAIRGCIVAPAGRKLVVADLSNIEGRVAAWLAGEDWKLTAFSDFDAGVGPDLYAVAYAKSFNVTPEEVMANKKHGDGSMRQIGKVQELMLQYEGGVGAFVTGAATYGIDLDALAPKVLGAAPQRLVNEASSFHAWVQLQSMVTHGLSRDAFVACDTIKRGWREAHPAISSYWPELRDTVMQAIEHPGNTFVVRRLKVRRDGNWLRIGLPSGRALCYPSPQIVDGSITYMGVNQYSRKWSRLKTYGGKLFENICQAVARDVMAANMAQIEAWRPVATWEPVLATFRNEETGEQYEAPIGARGLDENGFEIVLTVHDEVVTEAPDSPEFNAEDLASLLAANPPWAPGLPLAAAGFETYRYKKD